MRKGSLFIGFLCGIATALIGCFIFVTAFTDYKFFDGIKLMKSTGLLGKLITLGAILNLMLFFTLLHFKKETIARGVILATILLGIVTIFV